MATNPKIWSFTQLGGEQKTMVLSGWSAPFGRPRHGAIVNAGIEIRESTTYYTGNSEPTVHAFGTMYPPWELQGRFMDQAYGVTASPGAATVVQLRQVWNQFIADQQIVRAQWGDILSYRVFIKKIDLEMESENEIAWALHAISLMDEAAVASQSIQPATSPQDNAKLLQDLYGSVSTWTAPSTGNILNVLPQISDQISDLIDQVNTPFGQVYGVLSSISDFESASTAALHKLGSGIETLNTGLVNLRQSTDYFLSSLQGGVAGVTFSGASVAAIANQKAQNDADIANMLLLMASLKTSIQQATRGSPKKAVQAQLGDTWESIAGRTLGGADGGRAMRLINSTRHGRSPQPGQKYIVPKQA